MRMRILLIYFVARSYKYGECHVRSNIRNHTRIYPRRDKDDSRQVARDGTGARKWFTEISVARGSLFIYCVIVSNYSIIKASSIILLW